MLAKLKLDSLSVPGRYPVGKVPGLLVQVSTGKDHQPRRSFVYRYKINGRSREMGLGAYPAVSLAEARAHAAELAALKARASIRWRRRRRRRPRRQFATSPSPRRRKPSSAT
jgi:hypothetical protein